MRLLLALFALVMAVPSFAQDKVPPAPYAYKQLEDPAQEAKAKALMDTLRCLTCQSQSVADSDAPMAGDVRNIVREKIKAGENPEAVRQWLVERYGDWISYQPPARGLSMLLWLMPLLLLLGGGWVVTRRFKKPVLEADTATSTEASTQVAPDEGSSPPS